jgi:hypothetical protein
MRRSRVAVPRWMRPDGGLVIVNIAAAPRGNDHASAEHLRHFPRPLRRLVGTTCHYLTFRPILVWAIAHIREMTGQSSQSAQHRFASVTGFRMRRARSRARHIPKN